MNISPPIAASSSKVKIEDVFPDVPPEIAVPIVSQQTSEPIALPRELLNPQTPPIASSQSARQFTRFSDGPTMQLPSFRPPAVAVSSRPPPDLQSVFVPALGSQPSSQTTRRNTPPPDPKSLAYIHQGPYSNPLNIRPARSTGPKMNFQQNSGSNSNQKATHKKRLVVGNGWPFNRQNNPNGSKGGSLNGNTHNHSHPQISKANAGERGSPLSVETYAHLQDIPPPIQSPSVSSSSGSWPQTPVLGQGAEVPNPQLLGWWPLVSSIVVPI